MPRRVLFAVPLLVAVGPAARAGGIAFDYTVAGGGVGVAYGTRLNDLGLAYGMPMGGRVGYDPGAWGAWEPDPITGEGFVLRYATPGSFTLDVGWNAFASAPGAPLRVEWRSPGRAFPVGLFTIQADVVSPGPVNPGSHLRLDFTPWSAVAWGSQVAVPDLGLFAASSKQVSVRLAATDPGAETPGLYMDGFVTDTATAPGVAATPEPGSLASAGAGLGLILGRRRGKVLHGGRPAV